VRGARSWAALGLLFAACTRDTRPPPTDDLEGLKLELSPGPTRFVTAGAVDSTAAEIGLEVGSPLSTATAGCFEDGPRVEGQVKTAFPDGSGKTLPELTLRGLTFGGRRYVPFKVALVEGTSCKVTLGLDVLLGWALHFDLARRQVEFSRSKARAEYEAAPLAPAEDGWETHLLEVTRDPTGDWPMLAMRVKQADQTLTAPFLLSTLEALSRVSSTAARGAGLRAGKELFDGLPIPEGVMLPDSLVLTDVVAADALELSPGFGLSARTLRVDSKWQGKGVAGVLAGDVWGRFNAVVDVGAGVLWLKRPRVVESGPVQHCIRSGLTGEESCYQLAARSSAQGLEAAVVLWRALPAGGRLYLELEGQQASPCRIGFSFANADRGSSAHFVFPWGQLVDSMPACGAVLKSARGASLALYDDAPLPQCPGTCAFAEELLTHRVTCACETGGELNEADRTLLKLYKMLLDQELKKRERATEPAEPK
jgi:hypothetical protein